MNTKGSFNGGFIGILMLFIVVAGTIFFIVRTDLFTGQKGGKSMLEVNTGAIQSAKDVKIQLEQNNNFSVEE